MLGRALKSGATKLASDVCVRAGGDWPKSPARSEWSCDSKSHAAVYGESLTVDIGVSCSFFSSTSPWSKPTCSADD